MPVGRERRVKPALLGEDGALQRARALLPVARSVTNVFDDGIRHVVYELDGSYVLKVPREGADFGEVQRESHILPFLLASGVNVPELIAFDPGPPPILLMTKLSGVQLLSLPQPWSRPLLRSVAESLLRLHAVTPPPLLEQLDLVSSWPAGLHFLVEEHLVSEATAIRLSAVLEERWPAFSRTTQVVTHGDFWPHHCLVHRVSENVSGLVDLADSVAASPAWDFGPPWAPGLDQARTDLLDAYVELGSLGSTFRAECEFYRLFWSVRTPLWALETGIPGRGTRTALQEIERQLGAN
jgi:aminoglycoside phosphotransferase